ncbi:MAG: nitrous oxide-stimulated promoter family protein [Anaerolineae bacterium]|nr:nitrous oxide-stimulated promoter family protein [Anaerolineae bacterium]
MMDQGHPRLLREKKTIKAMVRMACRGRHGTRDRLCEGCEDLLGYALERLDRCPFQASKPTCADCPIHCYRPDRREEIRSVMRYAGPQMLFRHPLLALGHLVDKLRKPSDPVVTRDRKPQDA